MFEEEEIDEYSRVINKWQAKIVTSLFTLAIGYTLAPSMIPFGLFGFWVTRGGVYDWLYAAWPMFAWAGGVTLLVSIFTANHPHVNLRAETILFEGFWGSLMAGVLEEISFRWLIFLSTIFWVQILNYLFFGWRGFGIIEIVHLGFFGKIADVATFGALHNYLFHPATWAVGAALLSTNAHFREAHWRLGPLTWLNSWCIGMYLFWIMFNYGLPAAIFVHFLYDLMIYVIIYLDAATERALGWT